MSFPLPQQNHPIRPSSLRRHPVPVALAELAKDLDVLFVLASFFGRHHSLFFHLTSNPARIPSVPVPHLTMGDMGQDRGMSRFQDEGQNTRDAWDKRPSQPPDPSSYR